MHSYFGLELYYCFSMRCQNYINQIDLYWGFTVIIDVLYISITNWEKNILDSYCKSKWYYSFRFFIRTKDHNRTQFIKIRIKRTNKMIDWTNETPRLIVKPYCFYKHRFFQISIQPNLLIYFVSLQDLQVTVMLFKNKCKHEYSIFIKDACIVIPRCSIVDLEKIS